MARVSSRLMAVIQEQELTQSSRRVRCCDDGIAELTTVGLRCEFLLVPVSELVHSLART